VYIHTHARTTRRLVLRSLKTFLTSWFALVKVADFSESSRLLFFDASEAINFFFLQFHRLQGSQTVKSAH
jgi:hypothetical protein